MGEAYFPDQNEDFAAIHEKLARRRKMAEQLVQQGMSQDIGQGYQGGRVYAVGNPLGNIAQSIGGTLLNRMADNDQQALSTRQRQAEQDTLSSIPAEGPERGQAQLKAFQQMPSLRDAIKVQMGLDEHEATRQFRQQEAEANRLEKSEQEAANRVARAEEGAANRQNRLDARAMPTIHITNSGGNANDGKPLTAAQEKSALELGSNYATLNQLRDSFKDEYAGDVRSTIERQFGKVAGGLAPQSTQDMTRWWSDQAMFDELPQRHSLFGAALTPTEQRSWADASINPSLSPKVIRDRLATRAKLYDLAEQRMRANAVAGGKSGKQFDAATGKGQRVIPKDDPLGIRGGK